MKSLLSVAFAAILFFFTLSANASPQFGGCFTSQLCAGPSVSVVVTKFNLATSTFSGGVSPGVGYGLTFTPQTAPWATVGVDLYASFRLDPSSPNQGSFALMGRFADYVFLGIGPTITQQPAGVPALIQWDILGGIGIPIGGTPSYKAKE